MTRKRDANGNLISFPDAKVNIIPDPWQCETCKKTYQEKAEIYMTFDEKNFCCSKCFRIYERKKHAQELSK